MLAKERVLFVRMKYRMQAGIYGTHFLQCICLFSSLFSPESLFYPISNVDWIKVAQLSNTKVLVIILWKVKDISSKFLRLTTMESFGIDNFKFSPVFFSEIQKNLFFHTFMVTKKLKKHTFQYLE